MQSFPGTREDFPEEKVFCQNLAGESKNLIREVERECFANIVLAREKTYNSCRKFFALFDFFAGLLRTEMAAELRNK